MKTELKEKLANEFNSLNFFEKIPEKIEEYTLKKIMTDEGDKFFYFKYENIPAHRSLMTYFHEETQEYKVLVEIGLTKFCLTKFFTYDLNKFAEILLEKLFDEIKNISTPIDAESDILISDKNFSTWNYGENLPKTLEGFELFIAPKNPVRITNGSYIIIDYSDFNANLDLSIFYNVYSDNFSGESKIGGVHNPLYIFDAENLKDLEKILTENLEDELKHIRNDG